MNTFWSSEGRLAGLRLTPSVIALLADQLEKLVLEPYQEPIVHHLLQGKSVSEVAALTGESLARVLQSAVHLMTEAHKRPPPDAPQTVRPPRRPPRTPLSAAAPLEFSPEKSLSAVASAKQSEASATTEEHAALRCLQLRHKCADSELCAS